ncbi:replication protein A 70 kDa DNA-binding subunit D-like [Coffea arabica]|uniref:Replication protein A 70 kDa DNA-binding subunit D-like n=1 Tax=Coffea arabica TaxID=13443 RepID=A0ABM4VHC2_COFAR
MIYGGDIHFFKRHFQPFRRYYISSAKLETVQPRYSTYSNEYCWVIDNSTVVQQVHESEPPMLPDIFNFKPYGRIYEHIDTDEEIDLLGVAIHVNPRAMRGPTPTREIIIVDERSSKNQEAFLKFIAERTYADRLNLIPAPVDDRVVTIKSLTTTNTKRPYWIRGIPNLLDRSQKMWYNACPICYKYLRARPNLEFDCTSCHKCIRVSPRCRLTVQLIDHTGSITLDLNGNDAEQLLPFTIVEIQKQEIQLDYTTIEDFIKQNNLVCLVKKTQNTYNSAAAAKYIAIIAHIRNSTPEELVVISKYTTNYATTSASWNNKLS